MEKFIHKFIDQNVKNVDTYQHNGSTWLIFTDSKKWVIELTKDKTLWYNYNFFKSIFEFFSMDLIENQHYITNWVENNVTNKVKGTHRFGYGVEDDVEDTIQNGIKETKYNQTFQEPKFQDALQNGVKETELHKGIRALSVNNTIQNGVKETNPVDVMKFFDNKMEDAIQNGVKEVIHNTHSWDESILGEPTTTSTVGGIGGKMSTVRDVIEKGIKEIKSLPSLDGNRDWGEYYHDKEDRTKPFNEYLNEAITYGVKETKPMDEWVNTDNIVKKIIENGEIDTDTKS